MSNRVLFNFKNYHFYFFYSITDTHNIVIPNRLKNVINKLN